MSRVSETVNKPALDYAGAQDLFSRGKKAIDNATRVRPGVFVNPEGDIYFGDRASGEHNISDIVRAAAEKGVHMPDGVNRVILDNDTAGQGGLKVNVDSDINGDLILDNDALEGSGEFTARANVAINAKVGGRVISDCDAGGKITREGQAAGVEVNIDVNRAQALRFLGSNDTSFKTTDQGAIGLDIQNTMNANLNGPGHYDVAGSIGQHNISAVGDKASMNTGAGPLSGSPEHSYKLDSVVAATKAAGEANAEVNDGARQLYMQFRDEYEGLSAENSEYVKIGGQYNGKTVADAKALPHKGAAITYTDGSKETLKLPDGGIIAIEKPDGSVTAVGPQIADFSASQMASNGLLKDSDSLLKDSKVKDSKVLKDSESMFSDSEGSISDPTNTFNLNVAAGATADVAGLSLSQSDSGQASAGTVDGFLAQNNVNFNGVVSGQDQAAIDQNIDIALRDGMKYTDDSGNFINGGANESGIFGAAAADDQAPAVDQNAAEVETGGKGMADRMAEMDKAAAALTADMAPLFAGMTPEEILWQEELPEELPGEDGEDEETGNV